MKLLPALTLGLAVMATFPTTTMAGTESGFYLGAGVGEASAGDVDGSQIGSSTDLDFDGSDTGWKIFAGYNFGWIPLVDLAVEGGYVDFGKPDDNGLEVNADGYDAFGLVGVNLGPVGLFGKVGVIAWSVDASTSVASGSDDGTDPAYGIGARLKFGSLEVRAEYEYFDVDVADDLSLISASGVWTF
jgi:opacity protein-like surface antigen